MEFSYKRIMASFTVGPLKPELPLLLFLLLLVVCPVPISASHPKKPQNFTFYLQETNSTLTHLTNSTLGSFAVLNQPLMTEGVLPTSKVIGREYGFLVQFGVTLEAMYAGFEFKIDQSDTYNGTFMVQGAFSLGASVRTLVIVGGTGDFYLARGYVTFTQVALNRALGSATQKYMTYFEF